MLGYNETYKIEPFVFKVNSLNGKHNRELWPNNVPCLISVGDWLKPLVLQDCANEIDMICQSLERYTFDLETEIRMMHQGEPLTIRLTNTSRLRDETSSSFKYVNDNDIVKVEICQTYKEQNLIAYCKEKECLAQIYYSFLAFARIGCIEYLNQDRKDTENLKYSPLTFYNVIKSQIVEMYLTNQQREDDKNSCRQAEIKAIYGINPDYCAALYHDTEWAYDGPAEDDSLEFYDLDGNLLCKIVVPGIYKWCCDWEELNDAYCFNGKTDLDWDTWGVQGMQLAQEMRSKLPHSVDLWIEHPYDSPNRRNKPMLLIQDYKQKSN